MSLLVAIGGLVGLFVLFVYAFAVVFFVMLVKLAWTNGVQLLRTMLSIFVIVVGLVLAGCLMHALEVAFQ